MISYEILLQQLERHVIQAKNATNEQMMREELAAVRALCEMVLTTNRQPTITQATALSTQSPGTHLKENDANGNSIFDF